MEIKFFRSMFSALA